MEKVCPNCRNPFLVGGRGKPKVSQVFCKQSCQAEDRRLRPPRAAKLANRLSPTQAAYFAGLIDGEGHIALYKRPDSAHGRVVPRMGIGMTKRECMDWIMAVTGVGTLNTDWDGNVAHARRIQWVVTGKVAADLAAQILPFLVLKGEQAKLIIEFQQRVDTEKERGWMDSYLTRVKELNRRGYVPEEDALPMATAGDTIVIDGRTGQVERVEADGTLHVWFGDTRPVDGARLLEIIPPLPTDQGELAAAKAARLAAIDVRTDALIALGFRFPPAPEGNLFSLAPSAVQQLIGAYAGREHPLFTYPVKWGALDGTSVTLPDAASLEMFYLVAVGTVRARLDSGQALKEQVVAAQTLAEVEAVVDNR